LGRWGILGLCGPLGGDFLLAQVERNFQSRGGYKGGEMGEKFKELGARNYRGIKRGGGGYTLKKANLEQDGSKSCAQKGGWKTPPLFLAQKRRLGEKHQGAEKGTGINRREGVKKKNTVQ